MSAPRSRMLDLGEGRPKIEVLEAGDGEPLLFLHGAGGIAAWEGVLPLLSERFHVQAPLLPGFGRSDGLDYLEDQFDLFLHGFDVIEALGLERPYVVGESMGGWLAAEMAALRPKEIGRLALAAPVGLWRAGPVHRSRLRRDLSRKDPESGCPADCEHRTPDRPRIPRALRVSIDRLCVLALCALCSPLLCAEPVFVVRPSGGSLYFLRLEMTLRRVQTSA